uniref:Peroxisomal nicotinamide adenine dinucleotide carrier n=1 Tax=Daucus carota subsp. sativus TaxID=79200 RepID=A0A165YVG1_DAUCS
MANAVVNGLAGAGGGIIAQIITYPLQTVNTRQQTERIAKKADASSAAPPPPRSTLLQLIQVIRSEGVGGLYSGLKPSLFGVAASLNLIANLDSWITMSRKGIYYYFYQVFKNKAEAIAATNRIRGRGDGTVGMFSWLLVAASAGSLNVLLTNPIWVLVTRMQTHTQAETKMLEAKKEALRNEASQSGIIGASLQEKFAELDSIKPQPYGTRHAASEVYNEAGIAGFWKGIVPTLIMVCNPSIQFMIYETSLKRLRAKRAANKQGSKDVSALEVFLLGAVAKLGATLATYPLLVVKSRLQAKQDIGGNISLRYSGKQVTCVSSAHEGTLDAIIKMIRYEGFSSFYKGMSTKIVQSVFAASVLFMIKEELVKAISVLVNKRPKYLLNVVK